jgi:hypothetical protein
MDKKVRERALAYAAKTVFSVAFLAACASNGDDSENASEGAVVSSLSPACRSGLPKLERAFPDGDRNWWAMDVNPALAGQEDVTACCKEIVPGDYSPDAAEAYLHGIEKFRHVGCCSADYRAVADAGDAGLSPAQVVGMACTPWGPPMPPAMTESVAQA